MRGFREVQRICTDKLPTESSCIFFYPGAPLILRPLEDREVPVAFSPGARPFVPEAPLSPRPLEDREVPALCSTCARPFVLGAPFGPRPLEEC